MQALNPTLLHSPRGERTPPPSTGVHSASFGFLPAFRDPSNGETHLAVNEDGTPSPIHVLDGLPEAWVAERDELGRVIELRDGIVPGFLRDGRFFSYRELMLERPRDS